MDASMSTRHIRQKSFEATYRVRVFKQNGTRGFNALTHLGAILFVCSKPYCEVNVVFLRLRNEFLQPHPIQDTAREPPSHESAFLRYDRRATLDCLHGGIEPGKPDSIDHDIGAFQPAVKGRPALPGNESHIVVEAQSRLAEDLFQATA